MTDLPAAEQALIAKLTCEILRGMGNGLEGYDGELAISHLHAAITAALTVTFGLLPSDEAKIAHLNSFISDLNKQVTGLIKSTAETAH